MADLGFKDRHVPALLDGSKPFTLRRAWRNGRTPDIGARIGLVSGWRTPQRRKFATALVEFRCEVVFDCGGLAAFSGWRTVDMPSPAAGIVRGFLDAVSAHSDVRAEAALGFVRLDGFPDYESFWTFHSKHRAEGADPAIRRELIGLGLVTAEFAP